MGVDLYSLSWWSLEASTPWNCHAWHRWGAPTSQLLCGGGGDCSGPGQAWEDLVSSRGGTRTPCRWGGEDAG